MAMMMAASGSKQNPDPGLIRQIMPRVLGVILSQTLQSFVLFIAAGRLNWWAGWAAMALHLLGLVISTAFLAVRSPDLLRARAHYGSDYGWDQAAVVGYGLTFFVLVPLIAGLDNRLEWSAISIAVQVGAFVVFALALALGIWAMMVNAFFDSHVRIQTERGHHVVTTGPYAAVRHPGYVSGIVMLLALPLMFESWWAMIPACIGAASFVVRTELEDRTLQAELDGYAEYAQQTRYRLLPGIW